MSTKGQRIKRRLNAKQELAIKLFEDSLLKGKPFTVKDILRKAGYSKTTVEQSEKVMGPIRLKLSEFVDRIEDHRQVVLDRMDEKVDKARYPDLVKAFEVTTKSLALLSGKPTEIIALSDEDRSRIDSLVHDEETDEGTT